MNNLAITYQHIANILSFEYSSSKLEQTLNEPSFDWDSIVKIGSKHYVIPAIYCRLKSKKLLHNLPKELVNYLEYITEENRKRNSEIITQIKTISKLFNENNIEYVLLKGSALLALGCFEDIAERMLGDIDILVGEQQLNDAYQLLLNKGYESTEEALGHKFFEHKHLPRLISSQHIAAVEIHRKLFVSYKYQPLKTEFIFNDKRTYNNINIPSQKHLLMHNILNYQISDFGAMYNGISFRSAYDTIVLLQTYTGSKNWYSERVFKTYFRYVNLFFEDIKISSTKKINLSSSFYLFKLKHPKFYKFWNKLLKLFYIFPILLNRTWLFLTNSAYRKAIILDKNRIYTHLRSIFNKN